MFAGLIGPGDRKSVEPMAAAVCAGRRWTQLHHFIADGVWDAALLESELAIQADRLVGGKDAAALVYRRHRECRRRAICLVGVLLRNTPRRSARRPIASALGVADARGAAKLPVMIALRLLCSRELDEAIRRTDEACLVTSSRASRSAVPVARDRAGRD